MLSDNDLLAAIPAGVRQELTRGILKTIIFAIDNDGKLTISPSILAGWVADAVLIGAAKGKLSWKNGNGK